MTHVSSEVRQTTRSPVARLARGFSVVCVIGLIGLGLTGLAKVEIARQTAQSDARRLREYSALTNLVASQRRRLAAGGPSAARSGGFANDASRTRQTLSVLQAQSHGSESITLTALQVSYVTALQRA